ncbi:hypothetical protein GCM10017620_14780 [Brevundimonas intermedia]|uniref:Uncharacterized protein n=1 Tax=Brevundimonas intermedia TaxID=74315 RepID=A0ABQ5T6W0_9CAUL|nr:hypothetical protein GCM10017620_14780 [Brevundimonas intermedia]
MEVGVGREGASWGATGLVVVSDGAATSRVAAGGVVAGGAAVAAGAAGLTAEGGVLFRSRVKDAEAGVAACADGAAFWLWATGGGAGAVGSTGVGC